MGGTESVYASVQKTWHELFPSAVDEDDLEDAERKLASQAYLYRLTREPDTAPHLPPLRDTGEAWRDSREVARRVLCLVAAAICSTRATASRANDTLADRQQTAQVFVEECGIHAQLTPTERHIIYSATDLPPRSEPLHAQGLVVLVWALGGLDTYLKELPMPRDLNTEIDVIKDRFLTINFDSKQYIDGAMLRKRSDIVEQADRLYRLDYILREKSVENRPLSLSFSPATVELRKSTFKWLMNQKSRWSHDIAVPDDLFAKASSAAGTAGRLNCDVGARNRRLISEEKLANAGFRADGSLPERVLDIRRLRQGEHVAVRAYAMLCMVVRFEGHTRKACELSRAPTETSFRVLDFLSRWERNALLETERVTPQMSGHRMPYIEAISELLWCLGRAPSAPLVEPCSREPLRHLFRGAIPAERPFAVAVSDPVSGSPGNARPSDGDEDKPLDFSLPAFIETAPLRMRNLEEIAQRYDVMYRLVHTIEHDPTRRDLFAIAHARYDALRWMAGGAAWDLEL